MAKHQVIRLVDDLDGRLPVGTRGRIAFDIVRKFVNEEGGSAARFV
jgi:hypothetical protein